MIARPLTFNPKKTKGVIMREKKNVIVVMLDTLQFNYLGSYGNTRVKTPAAGPCSQGATPCR